MNAQRIRELLDYDLEFGSFVHRVSRGRVKSGMIAGSPHNAGYLRTRVDGRDYLLHRLAFLWVEGELPEAHVDHINGNRLDNRWSNLRKASRSENMMNASISQRNSTGAKGVHFDKSRGTWLASLSVKGRSKNLGRFRDPLLAESIVRRARNEHHGEFANHG